MIFPKQAVMNDEVQQKYSPRSTSIKMQSHVITRSGTCFAHGVDHGESLSCS